MEAKQQDLNTLLALAAQRAGSIAYEGFTKDDENLTGNLLVVDSAQIIYSFSKEDISETEQIGGGRSRVWVRISAKAFRTTGFVVRAASQTFAVGMEDLPPPVPNDIPDMPETATLFDPTIDIAPLAGTLAGAFAAYADSCLGRDDQGNNCAHFLSDGFIRAGFSELLPNNTHINARCALAKRPVRARDMWSWFKSKAIRTSRDVQRNTGIWATFQLNERVYWGGHVIIVDTNRWEYVGRPAYWDWDQYLYQW